MALIYQAMDPGDAQIRAALVQDLGSADLWVYRVSTRGQARGDALWYITRDRNEAGARVWFGSIGMSQVKICFVDGHGLAGWRRPRPLGGRFG